MYNVQLTIYKGLAEFGTTFKNPYGLQILYKSHYDAL